MFRNGLRVIKDVWEWPSGHKRCLGMALGSKMMFGNGLGVLKMFGDGVGVKNDVSCWPWVIKDIWKWSRGHKRCFVLAWGYER